MKHFVTVAAFLFVPFISFAQPVQLKPGSSIVINGDVVSCLGTSDENLPPACSIRQDGNYFRVYIGNAVANSFWSFDEAIAGVKKLKETNLCR